MRFIPEKIRKAFTAFSAPLLVGAGLAAAPVPQVSEEGVLNLGYSQALARGGDPTGDASGCGGCGGGDGGGPAPSGQQESGGSDYQREAVDQCIINPGNPIQLANGLYSLEVVYHRLHERQLGQIEDTWTRPERVVVTAADYNVLMTRYLERGANGLERLFGSTRPDAIVMRGSTFDHDTSSNAFSNAVEPNGKLWMSHCRLPKQELDQMIARGAQAIAAAQQNNQRVGLF